MPSNIAFIGIPGSGKTHALTLLAITAEELAIKKEIEMIINERRILNREPLPLREYMVRLRSGEVLPPNQPDKKVLSCEVVLRFPSGPIPIIGRKTVRIMPLDIAGELLRVVMELIPDVKTVQDVIAKIEEKIGIRLTEEDVDAIRNQILLADGYILVVDAPRLVTGEEDRLAMEQRLRLIRFMQNVRAFRERVGAKPPRGVALLLTKVDQLMSPTIKSSKDVENFVKRNFQGIIPELEEVRRTGGKIGYFYSWLRVYETVDEATGEITGRVEVHKNTPVYSRDEYERLIYWIKDVF